MLPFTQQDVRKPQKARSGWTLYCALFVLVCFTFYSTSKYWDAADSRTTLEKQVVENRRKHDEELVALKQELEVAQQNGHKCEEKQTASEVWTPTPVPVIVRLFVFSPGCRLRESVVFGQADCQCLSFFC